MRRPGLFWLAVVVSGLLTLACSVMVGLAVQEFLRNDPLAQVGRWTRQVEDAFNRGYRGGR